MASRQSNPDPRGRKSEASRGTPTVRVTQDRDAEPVRVSVVEDQDNTSVGLLAFMIFMGTLLGTLIGLGADFGELLNTVNEIDTALNPPPRLCITGSSTILGTQGVGGDWAEAFEEDNNVRVSINVTGSVGGVDAAVEGECVHILAMSEPMRPEDYARLQDAGIEIQCAAEVGYDIIAFITDTNNPLIRDITPGSPEAQTRTIRFTELRSILRGNIEDWSQVANWPDAGEGGHPITIWLRQDSGTTEVVLSRLIDFAPSPEQPLPPRGRYRPCGPDNESCLDSTLSTPGSLYWVSVAWMRAQPPNYMRVLYVLQGDERAVNPLFEDVDLAEYPSDLVRPLYLFVLNDGSTSDRTLRLAADFLSYTRGVDGQIALEDRFFYPHFAPPPDVDIEVPFPEPYFEIPESYETPRNLCKPLTDGG